MTIGYTCLLYVVKYFKFLTMAYTSLLHVHIDIYNSQVRDKWPVVHTHRKLCYLAMVKKIWILWFLLLLLAHMGVAIPTKVRINTNKWISCL